jgi:hypothetical protein
MDRLPFRLLLAQNHSALPTAEGNSMGYGTTEMKMQVQSVQTQIMPLVSVSARNHSVIYNNDKGALSSCDMIEV